MKNPRSSIHKSFTSQSVLLKTPNFSKASSPQSAIKGFLFQYPVSYLLCKVIQ